METTVKKVSFMLFLVMGLVLTNGCAKKVEKGAKVKVQYTGRLEDGTVFDESKEGEPLEFTVGSGQVIPGFDKAVQGMKLNEEKEVTIKSEDAYGKRDETLIRNFPRTAFPKDFKPEKDRVIQLSDQTGRPRPGIIIDIIKDSIAIDLNHPLAGKDLTFKIKVIGIE